MDVFLGHVAAHDLPGGDSSWLAIALVCCLGLYVAALTAWIRARHRKRRPACRPASG